MRLGSSSVSNDESTKGRDPAVRVTNPVQASLVPRLGGRLATGTCMRPSIG